ncbi:hypothetical 127.0 kDa protein [Heterostelium album PN500]|uniref:Hypothetical 127.0 kDa protein n=1 Tax=Heterostelium pallidum (strain ATCC 26659 / Pp 5 / PN500) TaxID=670386 RepID=D3AY19_HETP5|nr:hypothetical 127.0 kDa protein [Heterostelium album PN500]EFA85846.1 hypothetical 127.0 kDa protein [Heterostelium album PN500]|eukprot:XP_020437952.1 hypothetical 127.0 kDa protein [Heterostelium album PN500]
MKGKSYCRSRSAIVYWDLNKINSLSISKYTNPSTFYTKTGRCTPSIFTTFSDQSFLNISDFLSDSSYNITLISQLSPQNQIFQLNTSLIIGSNNLTIIVNPSQRFTIGTYECKDFSLIDFTIKRKSDPIYFDSKGIVQFLVEFNFDINFLLNIRCTSPSPFSCSISNVDNFIFNYFAVSISLSPPYSNILNNIPINFSLDNFPQISTTITNVFIQNETSTFQSILIQSKNGLLSTFKIVKRNSTHITFLKNDAITTNNQKISLYKCDKSSDSLTTYTPSITKLDSTKIGKLFLTTNYDSTSDTTIVTATSYMSYVSTYDMVVNIGILNTSFVLNYWYPTTIFNNNTFGYQTSFSISKNLNGLISASISEFGTSSSINIGNGDLFSSITIKNMSLTTSSWNNYIFRIEVSSSKYIRSIEIESFKLSPSNLIWGDSYNGVYELNCQFNSPLPYSVSITDEVGQKSVMSTDTFISNSAIQNIFTIKNITSFTFERNNLTVTSGPINNTLIFTVTNSTATTMIPIMTPGFGIEFQGYYNYSLDAYQIDFYLLPEFLTGIFEFKILNGHSHIDSGSLALKFGQQSQLMIVQSIGDIFPPMITDIQAYPDTNVKYSSSSTIKFGWYVTIEDYPNGFSNGIVEVISNLDMASYTATIDKSNRVSGDKYKGKYLFTIFVDSGCRSQEFTIGNITLFDTGSLNVRSTFDPLTTIYGGISNDELYVNVTCKTIIGRDFPEIDKLIFTNSVDVGSDDRSINFVIEAEDEGSGVSQRHTPIVYLSSESLEIIPIPTTVQSAKGDSVTFEGNYILPFGWGMGSTFTLSIYGIVDNHMNYVGYSANALKKDKFKYTIKRQFSLTTPIIESASGLSNIRSTVTLYGRSFGVNPSDTTAYIDYQDGNGFAPINISFHSGIILQFKNLRPVKTFIEMKIEVNGVTSNTQTIYPVIGDVISTPTPTPTVTSTPSTPEPTVTPPPVCPGNPPCNNRGRCTSDGCQCNMPWDGPACQSQVIIVPNPNANPEPATGVDITDGDKIFSSNIKVVEVIELDSLQQPISSFKIRSWNSSETTVNSTRPTYLYQSTLEGRETEINVTIEFFTQEVNITFGAHDIKISPSTIKFSIELSRFDFKERTNYLQVVMESYVLGGENECSYKSIGQSGSNVKWIKLNIDDKALYGKFLSMALVDGRMETINNVLLEPTKNDTSQYISSKIGIVVPYFEEKVLIDPDFTNILDVEKDDDPNKLCGTKQPVNNKFSTWKIIAIAVAGGLFMVSALVGSVMYYKQKRKIDLHKKKMEIKLRKSAQLEQQQIQNNNKV